MRSRYFASAFASSVLPTPAGPSTSTGLPSRAARKATSAVDSPGQVARRRAGRRRRRGRKRERSSAGEDSFVAVFAAFAPSPGAVRGPDGARLRGRGGRSRLQVAPGDRDRHRADLHRDAAAAARRQRDRLTQKSRSGGSSSSSSGPRARRAGVGRRSEIAPGGSARLTRPGGSGTSPSQPGGSRSTSVTAVGLGARARARARRAPRLARRPLPVLLLGGRVRRLGAVGRPDARARQRERDGRGERDEDPPLQAEFDRVRPPACRTAAR